MRRKSKFIRVRALGLLAVLILLGPADEAYPQGVSRAWGLGARVSFWRSNRPEGESVDDLFLDLDGGGASLYFFTRLTSQFFLEGQIGGMGRLTKDDDDPIVQDVDIAAVFPFLLGVRFDLLPQRISSPVQPFVTGGYGPYVTINVQNVGGDTERVFSDLNFGPYVGAGANVLLVNWMALYYGVRYHFVASGRTGELGGYEFNTGLSFMWGRRKEMFRVESVHVVTKDLYPAYHTFYNTYPLAIVLVKNENRYPIEVKVRSRVEDFSERPTESGFVQIGARETKDIPVHAIFGERLMEASSRVPAVVDIELIGRAGGTHRQRTSAQVIVHPKNAWNGDVNKLGFFVTPDAEDILRTGRESVLDMADDAERRDRRFAEGRLLFDLLAAEGIRYSSDPHVPYYRDDRVQFASETRSLRTGDCDDLVVLYASLLGSLGIRSAFIDVQDPEKDVAHVYLMFDTGLAPEEGGLVSTNEKRYVVRENESGRRSIWIPVETTLVAEGFDEAWRAGARSYLEEGVFRHGLADGWVRVIDVE